MYCIRTRMSMSRGYLSNPELCNALKYQHISYSSTTLMRTRNEKRPSSRKGSLYRFILYRMGPNSKDPYVATSPEPHCEQFLTKRF